MVTIYDTARRGRNGHGPAASCPCEMRTETVKSRDVPFPSFRFAFPACAWQCSSAPPSHVPPRVLASCRPRGCHVDAQSPPRAGVGRPVRHLRLVVQQPADERVSVVKSGLHRRPRGPAARIVHYAQSPLLPVPVCAVAGHYGVHRGGVDEPDRPDKLS